MKEKPHIGIVYPSNFPVDIEDEIRTNLKHDNLTLAFRKQEPQMWNSIEWTIPGLIAAYLFKPYFEAFLKEAGKDHYLLLKKQLKKLLAIGKNANVTTITSTTSTNKTDKNNTQSKAISIEVEIKDGRRIKLMFDTELEISDWDLALDTIMELIKQNYQDYPNDNLTLSLENLEQDNRFNLYAIINTKTKVWEFLDNRLLMEKRQKERRENGN